MSVKIKNLNDRKLIFMTLLALAVINANAAPVSDQVTSGSASISQNGLTTNISQSSDKVSINWQNFSIGSDEIVNFVQPSASSIALNRVIGNEKSIIDGALNANGQVWLLNSNGVLFGRDASINTASFLATTATLTDEDFNAETYSFKGASSESIINLGEILVQDRGYIVLASNEVQNEGSMSVIKGRVELIGADSYSLDLNENSLLNLTVDKGVLDALAKNSGVIIADGGQIYLTTNAIDDLLKGVVNNTGIIEAQTIDDITGKIELFAHGGELEIGGTLDASAPVSGNGGFIETSGKEFKRLDGFAIATTSVNGKTGTWLIDPEDIHIVASGTGGVTGAYMQALDVENALLTSNLILTADNDIYIQEELNINQNTLTLRAGNKLYPMSPVNVNNTASLKVEIIQNATLAQIYAESSMEDSVLIRTPGGYIFNTNVLVIGSVLTVAPGATYTYKFASDGSHIPLTTVMNSGKFRVGNGWYNSVAPNGMLEQPWYYDNVSSGRDGWFKLTYGAIHLDQGIGIGGDGASLWNTNGEIVTTDASNTTIGHAALSDLITNIDNDVSGFNNSTGVGSVISRVSYSHPTYGEFELVNDYQIDPSGYYIKTDTTLQNNSGSNADNVRIWVGTRDDYVAQSDENFKTKVNIASNGFEALANQTDLANAIIVTESSLENSSGWGAAVLFYSTTSGVNTIINECCRFDKVIEIDPVASVITLPGEDGSYGIFHSMGNIADTESKSLTWYYAAGPIAELDHIVQDLYEAATMPTTMPTTMPATLSIHPVIVGVQSTTANVLPSKSISLQSSSNIGMVASLNKGQVADKLVTLSEIKHSQLNQPTGSSTPSVDVRVPLHIDSTIVLVNGGLNLPDGVEQEFFVTSKK